MTPQYKLTGPVTQKGPLTGKLLPSQACRQESKATLESKDARLEEGTRKQ